ncbi:hypothetical protein [Dactylosporangium sp. NPDC048998]|uniref:hypothetical protein n=1 Tax=Dactylosporangium sp. NPDC048998 TaxID=3363976 RepID=UPI0037234BB1
MTRPRRGLLAAVTGCVAVLAVVGAVTLIHRAHGRSETGSPAASAAPARTGPAPAAPPLGTCTFADEPIPGEPGGLGSGVHSDRDGKVWAIPAGRGFDLYLGGAPRRVTAPPNLAPSFTAVNARGDVLGGDSYKPWVYRDGAFHEMPLPAGTSEVRDARMNRRGDVVVLLGFAGPSGELSGMRVAVWPAAMPPALTVFELPRATATLGGITDDGMVAAAYKTVVDGRTVSGAVAWLPDGSRRDLPTVGGDTSMADVNGDWIVGGSARWNVRTGSLDHVSGILVRRVDKFGRIFGEAPDLAPPHPAVWVNGTVTWLPTDPERPFGMMGEVSLDGTRITSTLQADNPPDPRNVVWTCK